MMTVRTPSSLTCLGVGTVAVIACIIVVLRVIKLIICHPLLLEHIEEGLKSILVASVDPVSPELSQFTIRHSFGLLDLLWIQLYLGWINRI